MKTANKVRTYDIYCDFDANAKARRFAERHAHERTVIEVRSRRRWFRADPLVTITFKTDKQRVDIYKTFIEEFKDSDLEIVGTQLYVYKKKEEAL